MLCYNKLKSLYRQKGSSIMKSLFDRISKQNFIILCGIWLLAICGGLFFGLRSISPIFSASSVNSTAPRYLTLMPGDVLEQEFSIPESTLKNVSVIVDYDSTQAEDTGIRVSVLHGDTPVMEQPLPIAAIPASAFFPFSVEEKAAAEGRYTLRIENISESIGHGFSVPYTTTPNLSTSAFDNFSVNGVLQSGKILCAEQYVTGYSYYPACCIIFCFLLGGFLLSVLLLRRTSHRQ